MYAIGDVTAATPKAGVFAEGAARWRCIHHRRVEGTLLIHLITESVPVM
jgi:hypothetical protein